MKYNIDDHLLVVAVEVVKVKEVVVDVVIVVLDWTTMPVVVKFGMGVVVPIG